MANIQLKTLKFPGLEDTYVMPEISVSDPNSDGNVELLFSIPSSLITFYIASADGVYPELVGTYQADPGMSWQDWANSSYNTTVANSENGGMSIWWSDSMDELSTNIYYDNTLSYEVEFDTIEDGHTYYVSEY